MSEDDKTFGPEVGRMMRHMLFFGAPDGSDPADRKKKGKPTSMKEQPQDKQPSAHDTVAFRDAYLAELERPVTIREGGEAHQVPAFVALVKSQLATALKGGAIAQRQALELAERLMAERNRERSETRQRWKDYIADCERMIEAARKAGQPRPQLIPDPDDIIFDKDGSIRVMGPVDDKEYALFQTYPDLLDFLLMLGAYSERFGGYGNAQTVVERTCVASFFADLLHKSFPPSMKLSDVEYMMKMQLYEAINRRTLAQMIREKAKKAGIPRGRARIFPSVRQYFADDVLKDATF